jgi:hypothetical protein
VGRKRAVIGKGNTEGQAHSLMEEGCAGGLAVCSGEGGRGGAGGRDVADATAFVRRTQGLQGMPEARGADGADVAAHRPADTSMTGSTACGARNSAGEDRGIGGLSQVEDGSPVSRAHLDEFFGVAVACPAALDDSKQRPSAVAGMCVGPGDRPAAVSLCAVCSNHVGLAPILSQRLGQHQVLSTDILDAATYACRLNDVLIDLCTRPTRNARSRTQGLPPQHTHTHDDIISAPTLAFPVQASLVMSLLEAGEHEDDGPGRAAAGPLLHTGYLRSILRDRCQRPGDFLHRQVVEGTLFTRSVPWVSCLFTSSPFTATFTKRQFLLVNMSCLLGCIYILFRPQSLIADFLVENAFTAHHFRFTATQLRNSSSLTSDPAGVVAPDIGSLSLLHNGCLHPPPHTKVTHKDTSVFLSSASGRAIEANGFAFRTNEHDPARDPVEFHFAYCRDATAAAPADCRGEDWLVVGASECLFSAFSLRCFHVPGRPYATSRDRNFEERFDIRAPWFQSLFVIGRVSMIALGFFGSILAAALSFVHTARRVYGTIIFVFNGTVTGIPLAVAYFVHYAGTNQVSFPPSPPPPFPSPHHSTHTWTCVCAWCACVRVLYTGSHARACTRRRESSASACIPHLPDALRICDASRAVPIFAQTLAGLYQNPKPEP